MAETTYTSHNDSLGTSNVTGLLFPQQLEVIRKIQPHQMENVFGPGLDIDIPSKGYTDPEWYFKTSDGVIFGIGWLGFEDAESAVLRHVVRRCS